VKGALAMIEIKKFLLTCVPVAGATRNCLSIPA
jgi:hypothetical protein